MSHGSRCLAALAFAGVLAASAVAPAQPLGPPADTSPPAGNSPTSRPADELPPPTTAPPVLPAIAQAAPSAPAIAGYPPPPWGWRPPYAYPNGRGYRPVYPTTVARRPAGAEKGPMSTARVVMIAGVAGFGLGWVASLLWGIGNEVTAISCRPGHWGIPGCSGDDVDWSAALVPVVGPFFQLGEPGLTDTQKGATAVFGGIQLAGLATLAVGLVTHLRGGDDASPATRPAGRVRLAPTVGPSGGTLGLTGTF